MSKGRTESTAKPLTNDLASPRFPPPPRTPSLAGALRSASGTQPRAMVEPSPAAANETASQASPTSPASPHGFAPEESPSFDKKLTPVVPASWPEHEAVTATNTRVVPESAVASSPPAQP